MIIYDKVQEIKPSLWEIIISEENYLYSGEKIVKAHEVNADNIDIAKILAEAVYGYRKLEELNESTNKLINQMNKTSSIISKHKELNISEQIDKIINRG